MPFELRITQVDYRGSTPCVSGRLVTGRYFGPEDVVLTLENGSVFQTSVGSMGATTPQGWPILPEHDTVLELELLTPLPSPVAIGTVLRGIGVSSQPPQGRRPSNDWLDAPMFWALHYYLLAGDAERDESELCPGLFGLPSDEINEFYLQRFTSQYEPRPWPFFSIPVGGTRGIEVEYADTAEYQTRYKITDDAGSITVGYNSGHFSLPSFRWCELLALADASQDSLRRHRLLLLLFPGIYIAVSEEAEATRVLEDSFAQLGLFTSSGRSSLARNAVQNRRNDSAWTNDERFGWISNSQYAQRNPRSLLSTLAEADFLRIKAFFEDLDKSPTKGLSP